MAVTAEPDVRVEIDVDIFNDVYIPLLDDMTPTQILFGGSSSGKSVFWAERCVIDMMKGGRNYLICREYANTIASSARNEIVKAINTMGVHELFKVPKSDFTITCINGYQILFFGLDDVEKVKSITPAQGVITDIVIEEATETTRDNVKLLEKRLRGGEEDTPKRLTLCFNPILQMHWIYKEYFAGIGWADDQKAIRLPNLSITKTTYKDNKFLTAQDIARLEDETDTYYHSVYTLGNWGVLGNVVFRNYETRDLSDMFAQFTNHRHGGDFGFGGNPSAVSVGHYDENHKTIYCYGELYQTGLTNDVLATQTLDLIGKQPIVWDSAEPKSIKELKLHGVNAQGAVKGQDSVLHGIQWLQQQRLVFHKTLLNHKQEFSMLKWKEDRKTGEVLDETVGPNHLVDARRYGSEKDMTPVGKARSYEG
jgi:phage terminase large subunit